MKIVVTAGAVTVGQPRGSKEMKNAFSVLFFTHQAVPKWMLISLKNVCPYVHKTKTR